MAVSSNSPPNTETAVELRPSYNLPLAICLLALPALLVAWWLALVVSFFGLFLLYQASVIRLVFTATALDVYRGQERIRQFPYAEWQSWRIFWPSVPILFYFREVNSIHFLPVLFSPGELQRCLQERVAGLDA
ncbi:DUF3119 family protein [Leptolyngbya sp. FACHB-261]|uniref:DUF3119 family protein n=1 Tax=Leptolyngbya sp. FACHB-261 TaxID=2692806 RepID=UPI00168570AA|nr:DUF3119 family protein [Leptolyngbya sp. FACHB-261]MBD2102276.1 DUF3119 family protein [Leptolyngbya sp. FACHB-261]